MTIMTIILALIAVSLLIFIHELGHYFVARWVGMNVEVFSIGFGRPILKWQRKGVQWQIGILPFGGFVKITGMEPKKGQVMHEIPGGFFSKSPWARIQVALAGPIANMILAVLCFSLLWGLGGRLKPFTEFTKVIGYVDQNSELFVRGVNAGDELKSIDNQPYNSYRDLIYSMISNQNFLDVSGFRVQYPSLSRVAFDYQLQLYPDPIRNNGDFKTVGILSPASYLFIASPPPAASPLSSFNLKASDRLVWADGELLFSQLQLSSILNDERALLTFERSGEIQFAKVPRVLVQDLDLLAKQKNELDDWHFEAKLPGKVRSVFFIPYQINDQMVVGRPIGFLNKNVEQESFRGIIETVRKIDQPLKAGDRILAVDGEVIDSPYQLMRSLQERKVSLIVENNAFAMRPVSWKNADSEFFKSIDWSEVLKVQNLMASRTSNRLGNLQLIKSIKPVPLKELTSEMGVSQGLKQYRLQASQEKDERKKEQMISELREIEGRKVLGITLSDQKVLYNPSPFALFSSVVSEMGRTLHAILSGSVSPKWLSGPVGVVQAVHHGIRESFQDALFWLGAISLNLGLFNLLPIPVLDGGHICFSVYEWVSGRRISAKMMERMVIPFVVLLILLFAYVTFQDISRLFH